MSWKPCGVEGRADRGDLTIHHPGRRNDVGARARLADRDASVDLDRRIVRDRVTVEDTAVTVIRVLAQAEIGHDDEVVAELVLQRPQSPAG